jgi:outer membrane protein TolC
MSALRHPIARALLVLAAASAAASAGARCVDEDAVAAMPADTGADNAAIDPRAQLAGLVRDALDRSQALGAARLLASAALDDVEEVKAAKSVQAGLGGGLSSTADRAGGQNITQALQASASFNVSQLLYDGGRTDRLTDWRTQLAESARLGAVSQQEQLAATTVSLALERSRYRQHVLVYGQYVRKMACLVEALETIVRADRGRASELVQARKSLQQAELAQSQAQSQARQVEVRLRRLVGDGLPGVQGLSTVLLQVPPLPELVADVERSADLAQLAAQANAAERLAQATAAANRPQVSWSLGGGATAGAGGTLGQQKTGSVAVGISISIPLLAPGIPAASEAARKRAQAALLQREETLEVRRYRVQEVHEQTQASFDRARRVGAVLRDSEQVRNFTLQQWQQLGRRSLFDVMGAEAEHYNLRVAHVNALHDGQQLNAILLSLGRGVGEWLR